MLMDPALTLLYLAISVIGVFVIRSASIDQEVVLEFWEEPHIRQIVWLFVTLFRRWLFWQWMVRSFLEWPFHSMFFH